MFLIFLLSSGLGHGFAFFDLGGSLPVQDVAGLARCVQFLVLILKLTG